LRISALQGSIELPYLQLIMRRIWDAELTKGSHRLCLTTLRDELGGGPNIVHTHLDISMEELPRSQQAIASSVFRFLVTPSQTKFAHLVSDLSELTEISEAERAPVLQKLAAARILRQVPPARGQGDALCYEIFHDVLAPAILDWRTRFIA